MAAKVHVVFDAPPKVYGKCLNKYIHPGPKLQRELPMILLRLCQHEIAIVEDITEYLQVKLQEED